jgi:type II secretory pathway pseudopilin PulG
MIRLAHRALRFGFTLVELLVAMALTLFIMVILSQAFIAGAQTFADLKAVGDMNNRLRVATATMRADLAAMWLMDGSTSGQALSLSGNRPDGQNVLLGVSPAFLPTPAGGRGFFRVWQDGPTMTPTPPTPSDTVTTLAAPGPYGAGTLMPNQINVDAGTDPKSPSQWTIRVGSVLVLDAGIGSPLVEEVVQVTSVVAPNQFHVINPLNPAAGQPLLNTHNAGAPVIVCEGQDGDGLLSVNSVNHSLHFSVFLGNQVANQTNPDRRENYFSALIGDTTAINPGSLWQFGPPAYRATGPAGSGSPPVPPPPYNGQWAEVVYFLRENGASTTGDATASPPQPPMRLYSLYRRQLTVVSDGAPVGSSGSPNYYPLTAGSPPYSALDSTMPVAGPPAVPATNPIPISSFSQYSWYYEMSVGLDPTSTAYGTGNLFFNGPNDLTIPERRFCMSPGATNGTPPPPLVANGGLPLTWGPGAAPVNETYTTQGVYRKLAETIPPSTTTESTALQGGDLLLNDVISMDVQLYVPAIKLTDFSYLPTIPNTPGNNNTSAAYQGKRVFDTWSLDASSTTPNPYDYSATSTSGPLAIPFAQPPIGIQVIWRVWDQNTQKTRQVTMIDDL